MSNAWHVVAATELINESGIGLCTHGRDDSRRGVRVPTFPSSQAHHSVMLKRDLVEQKADFGTHQARRPRAQLRSQSETVGVFAMNLGVCL